MVAQYIAELTREVSRPRLAKYRPPGSSGLEMAVNYFWSMALAEALHPSLAALEVGVRNSVHDALTAHYGTDRWFNDAHFSSNRILGGELARAMNRLGGPVPQPAAGRVIAEFHFVYWTTLLSGYYHRSLWNPNHAALLRAAFPHVKGPRFQRHLIYGRFNTIRLFRNRVMHHEPLLYGFTLPRQRTIPLGTMHQDIVEAIGWMSPRLQMSVALMDRFPDVLLHGHSAIEAQLKSHLGIP